MRPCTISWGLIIAAAFALTAVFPVFAAADSAGQPRLEIVRAADARIVFREGRQTALFTDAELAYRELRLIAEKIEHDSSQRTVMLSGGVRVSSPEYSLNTQECSLNLATGFITVDEGIELINPREGATIKGGRGSIRVEPATHRVLGVKLTGNITAEWNEGIVLQGEGLEADFVQRRHTISGDFTAAVDAALLPAPLSRLAGGGLALAGTGLVLQAEKETPQILSLSASAVLAKGERIGLLGPTLKARFALAANREDVAEEGVLYLSGPAANPASGWILDERGKRTSFSARDVEKPPGARELVLKREVSVTGPDFSLHADSVSIAQEGRGVRVSIPERFRVVISPAVFRRRGSGADSPNNP